MSDGKKFSLGGFEVDMVLSGNTRKNIAKLLSRAADLTHDAPLTKAPIEAIWKAAGRKSRWDRHIDPQPAKQTQRDQFRDVAGLSRGDGESRKRPRRAGHRAYGCG